MQDAPKAVWSIPYVSVASLFPSLKQNFIAYRSSILSPRPDCTFEIHRLWQSRFSRVYSNCCCRCSFEAAIIEIGQSSYRMYSNNIMDFLVSTTMLNSCRKKVRKLIEGTTYICGYLWILVLHGEWKIRDIFVWKKEFLVCSIFSWRKFVEQILKALRKNPTRMLRFILSLWFEWICRLLFL